MVITERYLVDTESGEYNKRKKKAEKALVKYFSTLYKVSEDRVSISICGNRIRGSVNVNPDCVEIHIH